MRIDFPTPQDMYIISLVIFTQFLHEDKLFFDSFIISRPDDYYNKNMKAFNLMVFILTCSKILLWVHTCLSMNDKETSIVITQLALFMVVKKGKNLIIKFGDYAQTHMHTWIKRVTQQERKKMEGYKFQVSHIKRASSCKF